MNISCRWTTLPKCSNLNIQSYDAESAPNNNLAAQNSPISAEMEAETAVRQTMRQERIL